MSDERNIVIIGGGIIGCTSAYFLTRHPAYDPSKHRITLLEASKIAGGASGKAGGLLGLWAYPNNIVPLSFRLHAELSAAHDGANRWGYRRINCGSVRAKGRHPSQPNGRDGGVRNGNSISLQKRDKAALEKLATGGLYREPDWVSAESFLEYRGMGAPEDTAQVHPYQFTTSMAQLAEEKGAKIIMGSVSSIDKNDGKVNSVTYSEKETATSHTIPATDVVIAAGPWTQRVFPPAPISAVRAHSVTIRPSHPISAYALFTEIRLPPNFGRTDTFMKSKRSHRKVVSPEIYARPNDEAYVCGEGDTLVPLPETTADVQTDDARCQDIIDYVSSISDELRDGEVTARQACYLPHVESVTSRGPLIGETGIKGLLLATGHTCWGIQNGPGTGKLISEIIFDGKARSADISSLDPRLL
ncbi:MAG: hypothetical protein Q9163_002589 [Psora crenata]